VTPAERTVSIAVAGGSVTAIEASVKEADVALVYAPGAGSNVHDPFGRHLCRALGEQGVATLRIQFPYQEAGRKSPDRPAELEDTWRAAIESARGLGKTLVVGGRSMGGRIASQVVAAGEGVDRLTLFAYPLHPPGKAEQIRDEHFAALTVPVLFVSGTRDAFGSPDELRAASAKLKNPTIHFLESADHGFNVPKSSGRTRPDVWEEATGATTGWLGL
jgi:hypothetical protein